MKKTLILMLFIFCLAGLNISMAEEKLNVVEIEIQDEYGSINVSNNIYMFWAGNSNISGGLSSAYIAHGMGLGDTINMEATRHIMSVSTVNTEDLDFVLSDDLSNYAYHIVGHIPQKEIAENRLLSKTYQLNDLNKISFDKQLKGDVKLILFYTRMVGEDNYDDNRFSITDVTDGKTLYVTDGQYEAIIVQNYNGNINIMNGGILDSSSNVFEIKATDEPMRAYHMTIPKSYDEYKQLGITGRLSSREGFNYYMPLQTGETTFNIGINLLDYTKFYLSTSDYSIYDKSLTLDEGRNIKLSDFYYCSQFEVSDYDRLTLKTQFKDFNGNRLNPLGTDIGDDITMDIYDTTDRLIESINFSSYWTELNLKLDQTKTYKALAYSKVDPHQVGISEFKLTFSNGLPSFKLDDFYLEDYTPTHPITVSFEGDAYHAALTLNNEWAGGRTYEIVLSGQEEKVIDTITLDANRTIEKQYNIEEALVNADPSIALVIRAKDKDFNSQVIAELQAKDIAGHWAEASMQKLLLQGIIFNRETDQYEPQGQITRGEFAAFLASALELKKTSKTKDFTDVADHALVNYIDIASSNGLIGGYADGSFKPDNNIKRQDLAIIIMRGLSLKGVKLPTEELAMNFADGDTVSGYALPGINYCIKNGILSGKPGNKLDPQAFLTRAEAAVVLNKILKYFD